ncbi:MAG TPA: alpha-L-arabinofuranosidase C-terminal domain-containing protein [Candidatus Sulfopaludibacter sp.]|nr:alpha-L-arabinofuranosidase C-terminal domain-containing protein [Candidatus Sulfopaludibacter sp.]
MANQFSRRHFAQAAAAASLTSLLPRIAAAPASGQKVSVLADSEIGTVRPEFHSHFAEHLGSCVYGGLWVGKDSPIPNINGYRRDVVTWLKELGIPVLRWPGGCFADDYHWRDGIGPAARRPKRVNLHWGSYVEDNSFGIHEFIGLCRLIGAEPYIAGNVGSGDPRELRDWVEYCNYPSGSSLAEERAANGSAEPFAIRYWGVGNENWGCGGPMTPEHYGEMYRIFANYMRSFGGTRLYLVACGPSGNDMRWARGLLNTIAAPNRMPNGWSTHSYENGSEPPERFTVDGMNQQLRLFRRLEDTIVAQRALLDSYDPERRCGLILDEWGVWDRIPAEDEKRFGRLWQQSTMRSAVGAGLGLNIFNRLADKLYMCNIAQIVNVLQSVILTDGPEGKRAVRTSTYYAFQLFKPHRGNTAVRVETESNDVLSLSVSASRRGGQLVVSFVNPAASGEIDLDCTLRGFPAKSGSAEILHHTDRNAFNGFDNPDTIVPKPHKIGVEGSQVKLTVPALSVITATLSA